MRETRRLHIQKKVFTKSDVLNIGRVLLNEHQSAQTAGNRNLITFQINCDDGTSYESESIGLFEDGGIIDLKRTKSLEMTFHDYKLDRYINISVVHGEGYRDYLIVKGNEHNWVNGIFTKLKEVIDSVKPQDNWIIKHRTIILHISALGIGTIITSVLWFIIGRHLKPIENPSETLIAIRAFLKNFPLLSYLLDWLLNWLIGFPLGVELRQWLLNLWPQIEFDFGPEHLKVEKLRRIRIFVVFTLVIIPIVLAITFDIVNKLIIK